MTNARPFSISTFQDLSNDTKNTPMRGVLGLAVELWSFGSPRGLQIPTFPSVGLHPHTWPKWGCDSEWSCNNLHNLMVFACIKIHNAFCNLMNVFGTWMSRVINYNNLCCMLLCRNPILKECEDDTHTPKMGTCESSRTPENSKSDYRGQNTLPWGVLYIVGKFLKSRCRKWLCMNHSDICSTSYGKKKGRESNWQFDSWSLKVGNWPDPDVCRWSATHCRKVLKESYKFALDLNPIRGLSKEL
jgi:hypothetical protein